MPTLLLSLIETESTERGTSEDLECKAGQEAAILNGPFTSEILTMLIGFFNIPN
jgi:hypothetical protein